MDRQRLTDAIYRGLIADGSIADEGMELVPLGENEILVNIGSFNEKFVQENPQKFIITVSEQQ